MDNNHTLTFQSWDHTCSDGCCVSWGTTVFFDGEEIGELEDLGFGEVVRLIMAKFGKDVIVENL